MSEGKTHWESAVNSNRLHTLSLVALAALGMILVLLRNHPYGTGLHWDSVNYIGTADNLLAGEGLKEYHGGRYGRWGPLYPILLALSGLLSGFDPLALAGPLNALLFGLTVFVAGHWLRECIKSRWLALWGFLALAFSLPLTTISSTAMSETVFILFVTLALFSMDRFQRDGKFSLLIYAGLFTTFASLTRYAGLTLVIALLLFLMLQPGVGLREKIKRAALYMLASLSLIGPWMQHNLMFFAGGSDPTRFGLAQFLDSSLSSLGRWVLPGLPQESAAGLGAVMLFALAIALGFVSVRVWQQPKTWRHWRAFCLCGGFALVYFTVMGILSELVEYDLVNWHSRYWAPLYIPLLFVLVAVLDRLLMRMAGRTFSRGLAVIIGILLFIWLGGIAELNRQAVVRANQGEGEHKYYAASHVVNNDVLRFIREAPRQGKVLLNGAYHSRRAVLYLYADRPFSDFNFLPQDLESLQQTVTSADEGDWLVWFRAPHQPYSYGLADLEALPELEQVVSFDTGVVFRIRVFG